MAKTLNVFLRRCVGGLMGMAALQAGAESYPDRSIRLIIPVQAGASTNDTIPRGVGQRLAAALGQGLRWALKGPFGSANTETDGGIREFLGSYGSNLEAIWQDLARDTALTPDLIEGLGAGTDHMYRRTSREDQRQWRDDMVSRLRWLKDTHPLEPPAEE